MEKVCHNLRISSNKVLKGVAQRGKTSTRMVL
ncbi:transposase [Candidatus Midichloria mitochondrii]